MKPPKTRGSLSKAMGYGVTSWGSTRSSASWKGRGSAVAGLLRFFSDLLVLIVFNE